MIRDFIKKILEPDKEQEINSASVKFLQENRTQIVERRECVMLGRRVKFIRPSDNQDDEGVVISDFFSGTERLYKIWTGEEKLVNVPDKLVYSVSGINDKIPDVADVMGRLEQYCNSCCLLVCEKDCPLFKYDLKHDLRME